jgi:hypothetical protein
MRVFPGSGTPGLAVPQSAADLAPRYDLTLSHPDPGADSFAAFQRWLGQAAAEHGLTAALLHDSVVAEAIARLADSRLAIGFHLDYYAVWHRPGDPYARLAEAVQASGGHSVNAPARARTFTNKAAAHAELARRGLGVPATVVVPSAAAPLALTAEQRADLRLGSSGASVYIKPANGYGGRGVVRLDQPDDAALARGLAAARHHDPTDAYLIQRAVRPPLLDTDDGSARPAYWRLFWCLGELTMFWWQPQQAVGPAPSYVSVSARDVEYHHLPLVQAYAHDLAKLTGLDWFSTELCLGNGPEPSRYVVPGHDYRGWPVLAVDYVNDQCDVDVQSRWPGAPPDAFVQAVARRFAEAAARQRPPGTQPGPQAA